MKRTHMPKRLGFLAILLSVVSCDCGDDKKGGSSLSIDKRARSCDLLIVEGETRIEAVVFGEGVQGTFVREAPNVAVSFIATEDSSIDADAVVVQLADADGEFEITQVACADSAGEPLEDPKVSIGSQ